MSQFRLLKLNTNNNKNGLCEHERQATSTQINAQQKNQTIESKFVVLSVHFIRAFNCVRLCSCARFDI